MDENSNATKTPQMSIQIIGDNSSWKKFQLNILNSSMRKYVILVVMSKNNVFQKDGRNVLNVETPEYLTIPPGFKTIF